MHEYISSLIDLIKDYRLKTYQNAIAVFENYLESVGDLG